MDQDFVAKCRLNKHYLIQLLINYEVYYRMSKRKVNTIITHLYSTFRTEDTEVLEDTEVIF